MDTLSRHTLLDIWLESELTQDHIDLLCKKVRINLTVLEELRYHYESQGITYVFVLSESHCFVHTYPEADYLSVDFYICNPGFDLDSLCDAVLSDLPIKKVVRKTLERGRP